jgi:riboflavin kinase / FMN adenylyltransferase
MSQTPFQHLVHPNQLPAALSHPILAIGNFDGMHRGHRVVFDRALALGRDRGAPVAALTFEPHPRSFFKPDQPVFRLTPSAMKARLAERFGLQGLIDLAFDAGLATTSAGQFVSDILQQRFNLSGLVVGYDFSFGKARSGNAAFLALCGEKAGFPVVIVEQQLLAGRPVSSSHIRNALEEGDLTTANALLGYSYSILGEVVHGRKLGRTIGYPTANIALEPNTKLRMGIYAVRMTVNGRSQPGVASFGKRPTFDDGPPLLEVFLFDFAGDLYGQMVEVAFEAYLRPEMKFDGVAPLVAQMDHDSLEARRLLGMS